MTPTAADINQTGDGLQPLETVVVPVIREELVIQKRADETGRVAVHVTPTERTEVVDVPLMEEVVEVERVPINRPVDHATPVRQEGDVTIVPVFEEVLVVEKRLILKEEIRLTRRHHARQERQEVTVRTEQVRIERTGPTDVPPRLPSDSPQASPADSRRVEK